jgi:ABC-2 type transport system ATP-binding protein
MLDRQAAQAPPGERTAAVVTQGLVKQYGGRSGVVEAVRGVDLRVEAGEVFGFLGPNGAGKSTTVRMLTTLLSITSGTAWWPASTWRASPTRPAGGSASRCQEAGLDPRQSGPRAAGPPGAPVRPRRP